MSGRPRALIAEDEPLLAAALAAELAIVWPELEVAAISPNGPDALQRLMRERFEVAFLDIRMPGASGLDVARAMVEDWPADKLAPLLVFVTAYDEFAVEAFAHAALDYVVKPVQRERLAVTCERLRRRLEQTDAQASVEAWADRLRALLLQPASTARSSGPAAVSGGVPLRFLRAGFGNTVRLIPLDAVIYLQADDKYVTVVTDDGEALIREPIKELLPRLDAERFMQVHRSTIVNIDRIEAAVRDDAGRLQLRLRGSTRSLPVSRLHAPLFKAM